jgi:2-methylisocitrate lyase-like PEP mutase family enzyme
MTTTQHEKARRFQELHRKPGVFLIPNPWDAGSARLLAGLGFEAFATSSAAAAGVLGRRDGRMTREESLANARIIVGATDLPVAADLEHGFGDSPAAAAETILLAAGVGLVGGSIEDARADREKPIYDIALATERVAAAVQAARSLPFPFTLAARAENFVRGNPNLDDTIKRLVAYERAGADVLFAPGLPDLASVGAVCSAVSKPVNFAVGGRGRSFSVAELVDAGVKRISFAASFYRAAMTGLADAAQEARDKGTLLRGLESLFQHESPFQIRGDATRAFTNSGSTTPAAPARAKSACAVNGVGCGLISTTVAPLCKASVGNAAAG